MCNCDDNINSTEVSAGPQGPQGIQGEAGANSFGLTDAIVVSLGGNQFRIPITAGQMDWPVVGQIVYLQSCGYYIVDSIVTDDYIVVTDPLYTGNSMVAGLAGSGLKIGPAGIRGLIGLTGATGAAGTNGTDANQWFAGSGAAAGGLGSIGDFYLESITGDIYEKTGIATWTTTGYNIKGPQGATGATGPAANKIWNYTDTATNLIDDAAGWTLTGLPPLTLNGAASEAYTATFYIEYSAVKDITIETKINGTAISARTVKQTLPALVTGTGYATITISGLLTVISDYIPGQQLTFKVSKSAPAGTLNVKYASVNYVHQNS